MDARVKPAHDVESEVRKLRHRYFLSPYIYRAERHRCRAAHPGGLSCQIVGFEPFASPSEGSGAPKFAGAERRAHWFDLTIDPIPSADGIASP